MKDRQFDLVLWGATGFTGRLVAEHLARRTKPGRSPRWALGGRNREKLEALRASLDQGDLPLVVADAHDTRAMRRLAASTRVVCAVAGPFALHGSELVAACARSGTHYCDLTGEVQWIRRMIDAHEAAARESGARIVHACGFDSIPSDIGCLVLQDAAEAQYGRPCPVVKMGIRRVSGAFSGGTVASLINVLKEASGDDTVRKVLADPYSLNPPDERSGPDRPDQRAPEFDSDLDSWTAPFIMAPINTRIVRRSNAVTDWAWGRQFRYRESITTGDGLLGWTRSAAISAVMTGLVGGASVAPARALLERLFLPSPGEGPDEKAREAGGFSLRFIGRHPEAAGGHLAARVEGRRDPGYGATSRMIGEAALCLLEDADDPAVGGGFWTPASALGARLLPRLEKHADVRFVVEDDLSQG
ncbi:MAG: saccharopine dehydrogenase NADP-binding domain-containing protein [Gammaproteobacteria bacterium]